MTFKGLTKAQCALLKNILLQIIRCEKEIPMKYWCTSCRSKIRRISELAERFHRLRRIREQAETVSNQSRLSATEQPIKTGRYWQTRTDMPRFLWEPE